MDGQRGIARRMILGLPKDGRSAAWERDFAAYPPAGVIVFRRDFKDLDDLRVLTTHLRTLARPRRILIAVDEEGGFVSQLAGHLVVPPNAQLLARGAAPGDLEWIARVTGERLRALGIDWVFAPVADIHSEARNPVIGPRAYGTTAPQVTANLGEVLRGFRAAGLAACLKHFPGHGDTVLDSHLALPTALAPRDVLEKRELVPFRAHLDADAVMTAHVVYPALDPGSPATFSRAIAHDLLRDQLGFGGIAITDALEMQGAAAGRTPTEVARAAFDAGLDLLLFAFHDEALRRMRLELADALVDGTLDRTAFDAARPRLARFDVAHPEPTPAELARPLESLTPADWESRLERIVERGLDVRGTLVGGVGPWSVEEPESPHGAGIADELARLGVPLAEPGAAAVRVVCVASRIPLAADAIETLKGRCRERPTILVGLENDVVLDDVPEAAVRVSAADRTPLTRRVVARALAGLLQTASSS